MAGLRSHLGGIELSVVPELSGPFVFLKIKVRHLVRGFGFYTGVTARGIQHKVDGLWRLYDATSLSWAPLFLLPIKEADSSTSSSSSPEGTT